MEALICPRCGAPIPEGHGEEHQCEYCGSLLRFTSESRYPEVNGVPYPGVFPKDTGWDIPSDGLRLWWIHYWVWRSGDGATYQEYAAVAANLLKERHDQRLFGDCQDARNAISRLNFALIGYLAQVAPTDWGYDFNKLPTAPPQEWS